MDIAALSVVVSQYRLQENAGIMVMKKAMDQARQDGNSIVDMLAVNERLVHSDPYLGNNIDEYV